MSEPYVAPYNVVIVRYKSEREVFNHLTREDAYARYRSLTFAFRFPDEAEVGQPIVFALQENEPTHGYVREMIGAPTKVIKEHLAWAKEQKED